MNGDLENMDVPDIAEDSLEQLPDKIENPNVKSKLHTSEDNGEIIYDAQNTSLEINSEDKSHQNVDDLKDPLSSDDIEMADCKTSKDINIHSKDMPKSHDESRESWFNTLHDNVSGDDLYVNSNQGAKNHAFSDNLYKSTAAIEEGTYKNLKKSDIIESLNMNGEVKGRKNCFPDGDNTSLDFQSVKDAHFGDRPERNKHNSEDVNTLASTDISEPVDDSNDIDRSRSNEQHTEDANSSIGTEILESVDDVSVGDRPKSNEQGNDYENSLISSQDNFNSDCDSRNTDSFLEIPIVDIDKIKNQNGSISPVVHEIDSDNSDKDDCIVTSVEKLKTPIKKEKNKPSPVLQLRRSSRAVARKKYTDHIAEIDDESDLDVIEDTPVKSKIGNNKSKSSASKASKVRKLDNSLSDPLSIKSRTKPNLENGSNKLLNSSKTDSTTTATLVIRGTKPPEPILPTLTDDMFVVEAPSFIVPYVYEKPAQTPLKEFVDKWGKEIAELNAKFENQLKEIQNADKERREQEKKEQPEKGETLQDSDIEEKQPEKTEEKQIDKSEKRVKRRRKGEDDDMSWDGSSSEESDDESISDDGSQKDTVVSEIPEATKVAPQRKIDKYFETTLGKFFMGIGANLVQEHVQTDLLNQHKLELRREKRAGRNTEIKEVSVALLTKNLELTQTSNESFKFELKRCKHCNFKTESAIILQHHLHTLHMRNNMYICVICSLELQNPYNMISHMDAVHSVKGIYDPPPAPHPCTLCLFEVQGKGKLSRHLINCEKRFRPHTNLAPPIEWEPPAKIPKLSHVRTPVPYHTAQFARLAGAGVGNAVRMPLSNTLFSPPIRPRMKITPPRLPGVTIKQVTSRQNVSSVGNVSNNSIIISPSPRQEGAAQTQNSNAKSMVMCEICDGYIKNLEQLRNHMQWVHKVKIHPKMIHNRPPLNCQKCHFRFFTDQGLERHLLGAHGLVTSAIQVLANNGKDAGRCPVCGRAYQKKLLAHVSRDHNLVLKPANLSYKCTVCLATFELYRQFESHVYTVHSTVTNKKAPASAKGKPNDNVAS